ncbi:MAG TPA: lactonase family protein [Opitutaceae bacterium]
MLRPLAFGLACVAATITVSTMAAADQLVFLGTYTRGGSSRGIYTVRFDPAQGTFRAPTVVADVKDPTFLTLSADRRHLYSVSAATASIHAFAVDPASGALTPLNQQPTGSAGPCDLRLDATGRLLLAANYGGGSMSAFPVAADGTLGERSALFQFEGKGPYPGRQEGPHAHGITYSPDNRFVLVPDLGTDQVMIYAVDPAAGRVTPHTPAFAALPPGSGPRHATFSPDGRHVYVINELANTVTAFAYDAAAGTLDPLETLSTLPPDFKQPNTTAEIAVHPRGHTVYASNRGHDSLALYTRDAATGRLTFRTHVPTRGKAPRHFTLTPDAQWLIAANQDSDSLTVYRVDPQTGDLTPHGEPFTVARPVCVLFAE